MKYIKSKQLQKSTNKRLGKYEVTLEVNDNDILMLEKFAVTLAPNKVIEEPSEKNDWNGIYSPEYKPKYQRWLMKTWRCFNRLFWEFDDK